MAELKFLNSVGATVLINGVEQDSVTVSCGATVIWEVSKEGYATQTGSQEVWEDTVIDVTLELERYEIVFVVSPEDAALTVNGELMELDGGRCSMTVKWGDTVTWSCVADGHVGQVRGFTAKCGETLYITLDEADEESRSVRFVVSPSDAVLTVNGETPEPDADGRYTVVAHDGDVIVWSCVCGGYVSKSGSFVVDGNSTTYVTLVAEPEPEPEYATITITPNPSDATVFINGEERTEYTVEVGAEIEWSVSKEGYVTQSGSLTIDGNRTIEITLVYEDAVFSDVEITEFSYDDIPASGGIATPTLKYRQTWGYGSETGGGVIEDGAEVSYGGVEEDGSHTEGSLGTTERGRTQVATSTVTVTLNGRTATASAEVWQAENRVEEYYGLEWMTWSGEMDVTYNANEHSVILTGYVALQRRRYTSGSTDNFYVVPNGHVTYSDVEGCDWARATSTGFTLDENTSTEMRGPYDNRETYESEGETISRVRHVYQEGVENPDRTIVFNVSPEGAKLTVNGGEMQDRGTYTMSANDGDVLEWSCECDGYVSQNGTHTVDGDAEINIVLEVAHYITVIPPILILTDGGSSKVTVSSDGAWTAETASDWLILESVSGEAGVTTVSVGASVTNLQRSGTVIFTSEYGDTATLSVTQEASSSGGGGTGGTTYIYAVVNNTSSDVELYLFDEKGLGLNIATVPANETVTITTDKEITSESEFYVSGTAGRSYTVRVQGATIYIDYGE